MMLEKQLEIDISSAFHQLPCLKDVQLKCARSGSKVEGGSDTCVAVASGFRQNDAFSLTPITVPVSVAVVTRTETDVQSQKHDEVVEAIADKLSFWHKYGHDMCRALSSDKFLAGELRMDGGSVRTYDNTTHTWRDTFNFSIRGAEKFLNDTP